MLSVRICTVPSNSAYIFAPLNWAVSKSSKIKVAAPSPITSRHGFCQKVQVFVLGFGY